MVGTRHVAWQQRICAPDHSSRQHARPVDIQSGQPGGIRHLELADTPQQSMDLGGVNFQTLGFQLQGGTLTSSGGSATLTAPTYTLGGGLIDTGVALGPSGVVTQSSGLTVLKDGLISG